MSPLIRRIERRSLMVWGIMAAASAASANWHFFGGVVLGGALSVLGFRFLKSVLSSAIRLPSHRAKGRVVLYHYGWMGMLFGILALSLSLKLVDPLGLLLGLSVVVMNLLLCTILDLRRIPTEG